VTDWTTIVVVVDETEVDLVAGLVWELGVSGIEEHAHVDGAVELRIGCETTCASGVVEVLAGRWSPIAESVAADAGLDAWREHAQVWRAGSNIIVPPWLEVPDDLLENDLVLMIDPGHAFGSASHETTRMCLEVVSDRVRPGMSIADIGCGSGVLSIAAARRGAAHVVATDISPEAIIATIDNARRNDVADVIEVSSAGPEELRRSSFDLVFANIGAATLTAMADQLIALMTTTGVVVLSGLLDAQTHAVIAEFENAGAAAIETRAGGEWRTVLMSRASQ
jgi:ribosomal protein L11 methyltransferase